MLVWSLVDQCLPHKEELAACPEAVGRGVTQPFSEDDSSGRRLGPMGAVLGKNLAPQQGISEGVVFTTFYLAALCSS